MSWGQYVDNLKGSGFIDEAAILGMDSTVWAASDGLQNITTEEVEKLKQDNMIYFLGGKKYMKLRLEDMLHLKAVGNSDGINRNVTVGWAKTCIVVGIGNKDASGGNVATAVGKIKDYLVSVKF